MAAAERVAAVGCPGEPAVRASGNCSGVLSQRIVDWLRLKKSREVQGIAPQDRSTNLKLGTRVDRYSDRVGQGAPEGAGRAGSALRGRPPARHQKEGAAAAYRARPLWRPIRACSRDLVATPGRARAVRSPCLPRPRPAPILPPRPRRLGSRWRWPRGSVEAAPGCVCRSARRAGGVVARRARPQGLRPDENLQTQLEPGRDLDGCGGGAPSAAPGATVMGEAGT